MPLWISIVILGIVEGITEFLPISSTGHLLIAEHWLPQQTELFNVVIQAGAVLAVIPLFHTRFHQFIYQWKDVTVRDYFFKIVVAFLITAIGGYIMVKKKFKLDPDLTNVAWALLIGGIIFVVVETLLRNKKPEKEVSWTVCIAVGLGQLIAARYPGASRSGTTIMLALVLGLNRPLATEFSFLVSIPTMLAASGHEMLKALHHPAADAPHENWPMVLLATLVAAVVSFIAVKWLLRYVQTHTFTAFGIYRIVAGLAILIFLVGKLHGNG